MQELDAPGQASEVARFEGPGGVTGRWDRGRSRGQRVVPARLLQVVQHAALVLRTARVHRSRLHPGPGRFSPGE